MTAHPRPPHDEDDDLDLRALYRTLPRAEPGPALDASVRDAAARAAAADRRVQRERRLWHPGWGVAASIVLTACLFLLTDFGDQDVAGLADAPPVDAELARPPQAMPPRAAPPVRPEAPAALRRYAPARQAEQAAPAAPPAPAYRAQPDAAAGAALAPAPDVQADAKTGAAGETDARIAHIRELLQDGRRDAALRALQDLQRDAPGLALPPDLQGLLPPTP